ncbi:transglycosylase domain-containing protein [Parahaliea aestuarii]|uniref:Penicillin-binding protein n=1 Tax=Parahaliea aestuarii TaxID=1852021 RepID=A0A5C8ZP32_9GAMM|nr:transglycosylase domain-containing protein [Parahaliea aestuarii]TXS89349.1 penicillin-binding protein [Parahaliea aestuarii]
MCLYLLWALPSPGQLTREPPSTSSALYDRSGAPLYYFYQDQHRIPVPLAQVSQAAIDATLAIEDQAFFHHPGFSLSGILRALLNNFSNEASLEGGSTITQQLVKNRLLSNERSIVRKLKELVLALWVELLYSKKQILEMYLNTVSYGGAVLGIEAASWHYFDKPAAELTVAEGALLAGLLKAPGYYNPFGPRPKLALRRQRQVLRAMRDAGFLSRGQFDAFSGEAPQLVSGSVRMRAPHFVMYLRPLLLEQFGAERLYSGGLQIRSTLDLSLQERTQKRVSDFVDSMFRFRVGNGAVLVTEPGSGQILAMVGSVDYFDAANDGQVNVVQQYRQPGSTVKPLTYAMALERGRTPMSLLDDTPVAYEIPDEESYQPRNDDKVFRGPVTLKEALASSYNVPAVKELASIGVLDYVEKAREVGIDWENQTPYRYALTLGSAEVSMLELAQMYSTFANLGVPVAPDPLLEVTDLHGQVLYENRCASAREDCPGEAVFRPETAFLINDILSDNAARAPTFGRSSDLYIRGHQVAVKSGTTDYQRDNWAVGYTSDWLVAAWIGNNDGRSMRFIHSGSHGASTLWNQVMRDVLMLTQPHRFPVPGNIVSRRVCAVPLLADCAVCQQVTEQYFVTGTGPASNCAAVTTAAGLSEAGKAPGSTAP